MSPFDLVLIVLVAAAAFAAGYFIGRFQTLAERRSGGAWRAPEQPSPLPGPEDNAGRYGDASSAPSRPRGAPPPASAGGGSGGSAGTGARRPPRRSTKPPPAIAGLMSRITGNKGGDGPK